MTLRNLYDRSKGERSWYSGGGELDFDPDESRKICLI